MVFLLLFMSLMLLPANLLLILYYGHYVECFLIQKDSFEAVISPLRMFCLFLYGYRSLLTRVKEDQDLDFCVKLASKLEIEHLLSKHYLVFTFLLGACDRLHRESQKSNLSLLKLFKLLKASNFLNLILFLFSLSLITLVDHSL